jgi:phosphoribosylglycinamide formyltransferase 1
MVHPRPAATRLEHELARNGRTMNTGRSRARLAVMISGGGRSMLNLHRAIELGDLDATIAVVIASRPCPGVDRAGELGVPVVVRPGEIPPDVLETLLREYRADWIVLAGYLNLLRVPASHRGRAVNIHPALLPEFGGPGMYGRRVHQDVIHAGKTISGCTVHLCDDRYDTGPIVLQLTCPVLPGDTAPLLADRVFEQECKAYPLALQGLITGAITPVSQADMPAPRRAEPGFQRRPHDRESLA